MQNWSLSVIAFAIVLLQIQVHAENEDSAAEEEFAALFDGVSTLTASFIQRVLNERGEELQVLEGSMFVQRPSLFRWEVQSPYSMTYLLRNLSLTVLDPDLEQVTYEALDSQEEAPVVALLLHNDLDSLSNFSVQRGGNFFELTSLDPQQLLKVITIYVDGDRLDAIDVRDSQGGLTEFSFRHLVENAPIDASVFELEIPPEFDAIGEPHAASQ